MKKRLLKKVIGAAVAMSLVLASSLTIYAAGSPVASIPVRPEIGGDSVKINGTVSVEGQTYEEINLVVENLPQEEKPTPEEVADIVNDAGYVYDADKTIVVTAEVYLITTGQVRLSGNLDVPLTVDFELADVAVGDTVIVMNFYNGAWHPVEATVIANGLVRCTFTHLSPVVFTIVKGGAAELPKTEPADASTPVKTGTTRKTSPKTGE